MRRLANWLHSYLDYTADTEAPREMHFWTGVSVLAAALRRRVWFDMGYFRWYPNFFIVFVAPPGIVKKTSTIDVGVDLIRNVKDVVFAPDSVTWQRLLKFLEENQQVINVPQPGGGVLKKEMTAVSAYVGELENFLKLHDEGFNGTLIALYDGKVEDTAYVHSTVAGVSARIMNPWLNLIGATTPSWIRQSIPENMIGGGLFSRIIFVCADKRSRIIAYPKYETKTNRSKLRDDLIHDLLIISTHYGEMVPTLEAIQFGTDWYRGMESSRSLVIAGPRYDGYYARKQAHVHKLAMILSISRKDDRSIEKRDLEDAIAMMEVAEKSLNRVFEAVGQVDEAKRTNEIELMVKAHKRITNQELFALMRTTMTKDEFTGGVRLAFEAGLIRPVQDNGKNYWVPG